MLSILSSKSKNASRNSSGTTAGLAAEAKVTTLNEALDTLHEVFPSGNVDEFRRLLLNTSEESQLYVVTDILLKSAKGDGRRMAAPGGLPPWERFRSEEYQRAVRKMLSKEFRGLSKSTIQAVLAEHNYAYSRARETLASIAAKSWRFSFSNFFRRSPTSLPLEHTASTGCCELDEEIFELGRGKRDEQILVDRQLAEQLNEEEHTKAQELVECECCFSDVTWEQMAACTGGHFFCHGCLVRSVQEGVYGQGKILGEKSSMKCLSSTTQVPCEGFVTLDVLGAALPADLAQALESRAAQESLERSGLQCIRCPFCGYAEADDNPALAIKPAFKTLGLFLAFVFAITIMIFTIGCLFLIPLYIFHKQLWGSSSIIALGTARINRAARKVRFRRRGTLFRCQHPKCMRESCISCSKEWLPFHKCYEQEEDEARVFVEKAMADAVKRTCPKCNVSFVKSDGCNKLTCPCGYVMCYICRADIRDIGYKHFCQHFRQVPGTACTECDNCDLYANEDEALAIRKAAKAAEGEYWRSHSKPKGWSWKSIRGPAGVEMRRSESLGEVLETAGGRVDEVIDWIVDIVME